MPIRFLNSEAPVRVALVDAARVVTLRWLAWFQEVGNFLASVVVLDTTYDPPAIPAGATLTVTVTFDGIAPGDFVTGVSLSPTAVAGVPNASVRIFGNVVATGLVGVTFWNVSAGAIDLDPATIRIEVRKVT